jgi:hypothetical protein
MEAAVETVEVAPVETVEVTAPEASKESAQSTEAAPSETQAPVAEQGGENTGDTSVTATPLEEQSQ